MWIREHKPQDALKIAFAVLYKCNHMYMVLEKAEEPESNCPYPLDHRKSKRVPEKHLFLLY